MRYHVLLASLMASLAVSFPQLSVLSSALPHTLPPPSVSPSPIPLVPSAPQSVSPLPYRQPNTDIRCDILPNIAHTFYSISTNEN
ncbi:hypothetical protein BJY01DRAFT_222289 [Aspergillus pseudoustus]|uniref:Uncharacterized protein n=1 Tax=Aspergillus pseudoustus TaxID=1810923 RepID=A0ABR4JAS5_9EURO